MASNLQLKLKEAHNIIVEMRAEGKTYKMIAEYFGCSDTSIRQYCIQNNIIKSGVIKTIEGQKFEASQLLVLDRDYNPPFQSHETVFRCKCLKCGEERTYRKSNILNGPGCHNCSGVLGGRGYTEWKIGQRFGFIEIIGKGSRAGYVLGKCICGIEREFSIHHLKGQGHKRTISCGCIQKSKGELKIESILKQNNINYIAQYKIEDFSAYAAFDFAILDEAGNVVKLIEFDGKQHFEPIEYFGGEEKFLIQRECDQRKNDYCAANNIRLTRIPYWEYENITLETLMS